MDWSTIYTPLIGAVIGVIVTALAMQLKHKLGDINDIAEMKRIVGQHNSLLLALAKAMFATSKQEKEDAKRELLEVYSKLGGQ